VTLDTLLLELLNQRVAHPLLDSLALLLTTVGLAALPALAVPWWRSRRPLALALVLSQGAGLAAALLLQRLVARPRPEGVRVLLGQPDCFSFPSGHAVLTFAAAGALLLAPLPRRLRWSALLLAALVAASRVVVGHHWPSDVLAGAVLGVAIGLAAHGLVARGARGAARWRWLLWPQAALVVVLSLAAWLDLLGSLSVPLSDKALHFWLFGAISFWLALWWGGGGQLRRGWRRLPWAVLLPFGLAMAEEAAQAWTPNRSADLEDLGCDLAGMICCYLLARLLLALGQRRGSVRASARAPAA